jgi:hypothetical protein
LDFVEKDMRAPFDVDNLGTKYSDTRNQVFKKAEKKIFKTKILLILCDKDCGQHLACFKI